MTLGNAGEGRNSGPDWFERSRSFSHFAREGWRASKYCSSFYPEGARLILELKRAGAVNVIVAAEARLYESESCQSDDCKFSVLLTTGPSDCVVLSMSPRRLEAPDSAFKRLCRLSTLSKGKSIDVLQMQRSGDTESRTIRFYRGSMLFT